MAVGLNFLKWSPVLNPACLVGMGKDRKEFYKVGLTTRQHEDTKGKRG